MLVSLLEEYKKAAEEYIDILNSLTQIEFEKVVDVFVKDPACKSIKAITSHVVYSGYTYANYINSIIEKNGMNMMEL